MPELLKIQPRVPDISPGQVNVPLGGGAYVGRGLQELGGEISNTIFKIQETEDRAEIARRYAQAYGQYNDTLVTTAQEFQNPEEFNAVLPERLNKVSIAALEGANPRVASEVKNRLAIEQASTATQGKKVYYAKKQDKAKEDYITARESIIQSLAKAGSEENRKQLTLMFGSLVGQFAATGAIDRGQAGNELRRFVKDTEEATASFMLNSGQTTELKRRLKEGELPTLDSYIWEQRANEVERENRVAVKLAEEERINEANSQVLVQSQAVRNNVKGIIALRDQVAKDLSIPWQARQHWEDRFTRQIKAIEDERQSGAKNPFEHSDPNFHGQFIKDLLINPEKWDKTKIANLIGRQLSTRHALQAVGIWEGEMRDQLDSGKVPKKADARLNTLKTIDDFEKSYAFIDDETLATFPKNAQGRPIVPDQYHALNAEKAQNARDIILQRSQRNKITGELTENPNRVLDEIMAPTYEQRIRTWGNTINDWSLGFAGTSTEVSEQNRQERIEARRQLALVDKPATEANIQKMVEALRANRGKATTPAYKVTPTPKPTTPGSSGQW